MEHFIFMERQRSKIKTRNHREKRIEFTVHLGMIRCIMVLRKLISRKE